jgi:hypothetical protein
MQKRQSSDAAWTALNTLRDHIYNFSAADAAPAKPAGQGDRQ